MDQVIGIDLGGTAIKLGRFDRDGNCLQSLTVPTPQPAYPKAVLTAMVEAIAQLDPNHESMAIGVGTPGPADAAGRIARVAINLRGWRDVPLADWLEKQTGKPTILANDANCAGMGEYWLGAGRSFRNLILLTLGTGVGGAVILNGELFVGAQGTAGELGLITLNPDGPECNSGNRGSLEQYASVQAIRRRTGLEPDVLGAQAEAGDKAAIAFWQSYGRDLGAGLASLIYILTPEAVIIGGGVSASASFFFPTIWAEIEQRVLPSSREGLQLLTAELGNQAGIAGAAKLAWQKLDRSQGLATAGQVLESASASPLPHPTTASAAPLPSIESLQTELTYLRLAYDRAVEMAQFKSGFLSRTSHELRSPINSVISLHQLILAELYDSPEEEKEFIAQADTAAKKMLGLLDELISVSKADYGSIQPQFQPFSLSDMLHEIYHLTYLQAQNRNLRMTIEFPDPDVSVLADQRWFKQVVLNLIDTPLALMQEGNIRVTHRVAPEEHRVYICIEDQRPVETWNEPLELLKATFNKQHAEQPTTSQEAKEQVKAIAKSLNHLKKPGLTLFISQTLLELMQGRLELVAAPEDCLLEGLPASLNIEATTDLTRIQCSIPLAP